MKEFNNLFDFVGIIMSNRFDDENKIEMDIKTAFASWGKYVFKCFPQEGRLRSFYQRIH